MRKIVSWYNLRAWQAALIAVILTVCSGATYAQAEVFGPDAVIKIADRNPLLAICYLFGCVSVAACTYAYKVSRDSLVQQRDKDSIISEQAKTMTAMAVGQGERLERLIDALNQRPCIHEQGPQANQHLLAIPKGK